MSKQDEHFYELEDEQEVVDFIRNYLPSELKEKFEDDDLYYLLDLITEYYSANDSATDDEGNENYFVVDEKKMTDFILREAKKDGMGPYSAEDVYFVILGEMEFANSLYQENED